MFQHLLSQQHFGFFWLHVLTFLLPLVPHFWGTPRGSFFGRSIRRTAAVGSGNFCFSKIWILGAGSVNFVNPTFQFLADYLRF